MGVPSTSQDKGLRQHVTGQVFYVDPNYPGASATAGGVDPTNPLSTLTAALAKCEDYRGDVIYVMMNDGWQYGPQDTDQTTIIQETVTVDIHGVRIVGVSPSSPLGPLWIPENAGEVACTVHAMDVLIEGFCFGGDDAGTAMEAIYAEWDGVTLWGENLTVRHCLFADSVNTAIQLEFSWYCDIHENIFNEVEYGIYLDPAGSGAAYLLITDNVFENCAEAMSLRGGDSCYIHRNRIYNGSAQGGGAATDEGIDLTGGRQNLVSNNWFSCLLPVPANGDWDDLNTASATDAWVGNHCMDGLAVTNPT
jgi:hypothetical protein